MRNTKKNYQATYKQRERLKVVRYKRLFKIYIDQYAIYTSKDISIGT